MKEEAKQRCPLFQQPVQKEARVSNMSLQPAHFRVLRVQPQASPSTTLPGRPNGFSIHGRSYPL
jgi:hypothetical protein